MNVLLALVEHVKAGKAGTDYDNVVGGRILIDHSLLPNLLCDAYEWRALSRLCLVARTLPDTRVSGHTAEHARLPGLPLVEP
jgi:hypothetical protein